MVAFVGGSEVQRCAEKCTDGHIPLTTRRLPKSGEIRGGAREPARATRRYEYIPRPPNHRSVRGPERGCMNQTAVSDRRALRVPADATAQELVDAQLGAAQRQLALARERLIAARRRVVALEEAVENWAHFSREVRTPVG